MDDRLDGHDLDHDPSFTDVFRDYQGNRRVCRRFDNPLHRDDHLGIHHPSTITSRPDIRDVSSIAHHDDDNHSHEQGRAN